MLHRSKCVFFNIYIYVFLLNYKWGVDVFKWTNKRQYEVYSLFVHIALWLWLRLREHWYIKVFSVMFNSGYLGVSGECLYWWFVPPKRVYRRLRGSAADHQDLNTKSRRSQLVYHLRGEVINTAQGLSGGMSPYKPGMKFHFHWIFFFFFKF